MLRGEFAEALYRYCLYTFGSVTSWTRTAKHNASVGGVPTSNHLRGLAADVVYDQPVDEEVAKTTAASCGLQILREGDHDHISPAGGPH